MGIRQLLLTSAAIAAAAALPAVAPSAAQAQPVSGLYIGGAAGVNWKQDQSVRLPYNSLMTGDSIVSLSSGSLNGNASYNIGYGLLGSIGWGFGNGLRAEIEGNFRNNGVDSVSVNGFGGVHTSGSARTYGVMTNLLFDMNINQSWIMPYIGAGVGYAWTNMDNVRPSGGSYARVNGTDGNFAYQAMLGAAFPIASVPGLALTTEYRFMGVMGDTHYQVSGTPVRVSMGNQVNHAAMFGLRYAFNAAPAAQPAPMPAAAPIAAAARSFMVFFDWDKASLTDRARAVIQDAASAAKSVQHTIIEVNGYADTSGSPSYNMPLSMKRAQAVAGELVRNGVAKTEIAIKAFGDTVLLVPTGPGVREPQNRRVEIIIK